MTPSRQRRAFSMLLPMLGAAIGLGLAGCAVPDSKPVAGSLSSSRGPVNSLSDLPDKDKSMLKVGDATRAAGDCMAAIRFYRMAADKEDKPNNVAAARLGAGECELAIGALPDALKDYQAAATLQPQDPAPLIGLGRLSLVEHKPGEAASYFDLAIKKGASAAYVWNDKGVALDQLRRHKEAQLAYRQGLENAPADRALRNNLALSLSMTGEFHEAESLLRGLVSEPGATARTRENLALVLGLEGDTAGARRVSEADLDGAALDNNERFYDYARATLGGGPVPMASTTDGRTTPRAEPQTRVARVENPVPPPVLVVKPRLPPAETKEPVVAEKLPELKLRTADTDIFEPPPPRDADANAAVAAPAIAQTDLAPPAPAAAPASVPAPLPALAPQAAAPQEPVVVGRQTADVGEPINLGPPSFVAGPVASSEDQ